MAKTPSFDVAWLKTIKVKDVPVRRKGQVLVLNSHDSVIRSLNLLESKDILSAPVWDDEKQEFIGSMDLHHIVNLIADNFSQDDIVKTRNAESLIAKQVLFTKTHIKDIFDFAQRNPVYTVHESTSLYDAIVGMSGKNYIRRALVFRDGAEKLDKDSIVSLISQTAILAYLGHNLKKLGADINATVEAAIRHINWEESKAKVVSIQSTERVAQAFSVMSSKHVSGLAVLDEHATLIGTIGIRDVRGLISNDKLDLSRLQQGAREFMNYVRSLSVMERHPAIAVRKSDTMGTLISKLSSTAVHRIFVIDEGGVPVGVLGPVDVLKALFDLSNDA